MIGVALTHHRKPVFMEILGISSFRRSWFSNGLTFFGLRVQEMAIAWLVLDMTGSKLWSGLVNGLPAFAIVFFALAGGVLSDRNDRRTVLAWSRLTLASLMFISAFLVTTGTIGMWQVIVIAVLGAGVYAMDMPIARTLVLDQVGKERLLRATSLNSIAMDVGAIAGPWVAGMLIADLGAGAALYMLSGSYFVAFAILFFNRPSNTREPLRVNPFRTLVEGLTYIRRTPRIRRIVSLAGTPAMAGVFFSMMPIYARDILDVGASGLGMMVATYAVGAMLGSVAMTIRGEINNLGKAVATAAVVYALMLPVFAFTRSFEVALAAIFVTGIASTFWKNASGALVQLSTAEEMRGRVMSVFGLGVQMLTLGWLIGGVLSTLLGNEATLVLAAVAMAWLNLWVCTTSCVLPGRFEAMAPARSQQ